MIRKETEWLVRIMGSALLVFAFYKLYTRPLTHSYHEAFLFNHLQIVLWVMLALVLSLVVVSFASKRAKWLSAVVAAVLLAPYPFAHIRFSERAESYFFAQRRQELNWLNRQILESSLSEEEVYDHLAAMDIRAYERGINYIAYRVDRMPEQRDGLIYLQNAQFPDRLFQFPLGKVSALQDDWYLFSSE